jgi:glycosyltransferase involved in cell wall biosynthesis
VEELDRRFEQRELLYRGSLGAANGNLEHVRCLACALSKPQLRFIGSGEDDFLRELVASINEESMHARVSLDGFVPYEIANERTRQASVGLALYKAMDANLVHSVTATNKLYEYAACALPVIVPDTAAYRDYLKDESWVLYADPASPASIADAVDQIFSDRDRYGAMCRAAREAFETRYNYETVFQPVLERILTLSE